jgi:hypothetical protein
MIKGLDFWYDGQMRRFLEQIVRAFSGFKVRTGWDANRSPIYQIVPCTMAKTDAMVANILRNGSENSMLSAPQIAVYMTGLSNRRADQQNPYHSDTRLVTERAIDPITGQYTSDRGRSYSVERLMPRPFEMAINIDIWTSNMDQKHQLMEQILPIFQPEISIQNSDSALDWSALAQFRLEEINWTSKTIPVGTNMSAMDIATLSFRLPFWLSPPAKVKQQAIIEQIITNIYQEELDAQGNPVQGQKLARDIVTPGNHHIIVSGNRIQLTGPKGAILDAYGEVFHWKTLIEEYGRLDPTVSTIHLRTDAANLDDWSGDISGFIQYDTTDVSKMIWTIDPTTLPANTIAAVDYVIDPTKTFPGSGLPPTDEGQRYLFLEDIEAGNEAWGSLSAKRNDVVQFRNGIWVVDFRPVEGSATTGWVPPVPDPAQARNTTVQYVINGHTGRQLRWNGFDWVLTFDGEYGPGLWRILI